MKNSDRMAYANSLSTSARVQALETIFWSYLKSIENQDLVNEMREMFLGFYAENLSSLSSQLPKTPDDEIIQYLKSEQKEIQKHLDFLRNS